MRRAAIAIVGALGGSALAGIAAAALIGVGPAAGQVGPVVPPLTLPPVALPPLPPVELPPPPFPPVAPVAPPPAAPAPPAPPPTGASPPLARSAPPPEVVAPVGAAARPPLPPADPPRSGLRPGDVAPGSLPLLTPGDAPAAAGGDPPPPGDTSAAGRGAVWAADTAPVRTVVASARRALHELGAAGIAPERVGPLTSLVDDLVAGVVPATEPTLRRLAGLLGDVRAALPPALQPLVDPVEDLLGVLLAAGTAGPAPPPATARPSVPGTRPTSDRDRGHRGSAPGGKDGNASRAPERGGAGRDPVGERAAPDDEGGRDGRDDDATGHEPRRHAPTDSPPSPSTRSDGAVLGKPLPVPVSRPEPTPGGVPVVGTAAAGGARSDRTSEQAVLAGDRSAGSPMGARAPPAADRLLGVPGRGPESRPG